MALISNSNEVYEIKVTIQGTGWHNFLFQYYNTRLSDVIIYNVNRGSIISFDFQYETNHVTIKYNTLLENCSQMFFQFLK